MLCDIAGVSRSGYYSWLKNKRNSESYMRKKELKDQEDFKKILEAYQFR